MTEEVRHLSPSKIETAMKCPEQFRLRYVEKIPEVSIPSMLSGRVIHKIMELYLKGVVAGKGVSSAQDMDDLFVKEWERQTKEEEEKENHIGWATDPDDPLEKIYAESRALIPFVRAEVLPSIKPAILHGNPLIEHTVKDEYETEAGETFLVWQVIDLVEENQTLTDWKTTRKVSKNAVKSWFQMSAYSNFIARVFGKEIVEARKVFLIRGKKPKVDVANYLMGPGHREWFKRQAISTWKMVKSGAYVANTTTWACSENWCSYYQCCQGDLQP